MDNSLTQFVVAQLPTLGAKLIEQLYLVGISIFVAILIGIPLGILIHRMPRTRNVVMSIANICQTIPSLALLAFLIPFFGIGAEPAIIALSIYAVLPIIRNTVTGIAGLPAELLEAAYGLGFANLQRLWIVELPLALPIIVAGIRSATAMTVGIATLAAFVGAGGLGDFINQGLATNSTRLILLGAIPAALLALLLDFIIAQIEISLAKRKQHSMRSRRRRITIIATVVVIIIGTVLSLNSRDSSWSLQHRDKIRIATKNFTEQLILGELMAQVIAAHTDLKVIRKFNLGTTSVVHEAMQKGDVDIYPEYTGTAYLVVLKNQYNGNLNPQALYDLVKREYLQRYHIVWLKTFGFNNTQAIAVRKDFAKQHRLHDISDLIPIENTLVIGAPAEFISRPDAMLGLKRVYHLKFAQVRSIDPGLMYKAIANNAVNVIAAFSTDSRILAYKLQILSDDKHLFPAYDAAPLIRQSVLQAHPEIASALRPLLGHINAQTMRALNYQVDVKKRTPHAVAEQFLLRNKLIRSTNIH